MAGYVVVTITQGTEDGTVLKQETCKLHENLDYNTQIDNVWECIHDSLVHAGFEITDF